MNIRWRFLLFLLAILVVIIGWYVFFFQENISVCEWTNMEREFIHKPIPQTIHRIWFDKKEGLPEMYRNNWRSCEDINKGYKEILWSNEEVVDLLDKYYPWFVKVYKSYYHSSQRAEAARHFIIYHFGGVYMDMNIECKKHLGSLLQNASNIIEPDVIIAEASGPGLSSSFFASKARHPFMYMVIKYLQSSNDWYFIHRLVYQMNIGSFHMTKMYHKYPCKNQVSVLYDNDNPYFLTYTKG